jgi:hypothetical protein
MLTLVSLSQESIRHSDIGAKSIRVLVTGRFLQAPLVLVSMAGSGDVFFGPSFQL